MQNNGHAFTELLESAKIYFNVMSFLATENIRMK